MRLLWLLPVLLLACETKAPPRTELTEGYCLHDEADRCFYDQPPFDGF